MKRVNDVPEVSSLHYHLITYMNKRSDRASSTSDSDTVPLHFQREIVETQSGLCLNLQQLGSLE